MTIAVGDSCLLVSNAQAREMADRIYEVLAASQRLTESLLDMPPSEIHRQSKINLAEFFSDVVLKPQNNYTVQDMPLVQSTVTLEFANLVAAVMKQNGFSFDEALRVVEWTKGGE